MKHPFRPILLLSLCAWLAMPAQAQSSEQKKPLAPGADASRYLGRWESKATAATGEALSAVVELRRDQSFRGQATANGELLMTYTGVWGLDGQAIQWHYLRSTPPTPAQARTDRDEIASFDGKTLVLKSSKSGVVSTFTRVEVQ